MKILTTFLLSCTVLLPMHSQNLTCYKDSDSLYFGIKNAKALPFQAYLRAVDDPVIHFNEHPIIDYKNVILECAQEARDCANAQLELAEEGSVTSFL